MSTNQKRLLYPALQVYVDRLRQEVDLRPSERKNQLNQLARYLEEKMQTETPVSLTRVNREGQV